MNRKINNVSLNIKIELKNIEKNYNIGYNEIYYFNVYINGKKVGGTRQYWAKSTKEIKKMIIDTAVNQIKI